jgi:hypothetical protein
LLISQHHGEGIEIGIGAQHENAIKQRILGCLVTIDGEVLLTDDLEEATIALVADRCPPCLSWRSNAARIALRSAASFSAS